MKLALLSVALLACPALAAAPIRLLLSVGSNHGAPDEGVLQYAEEDAQRVRDVFVELGNVDSARALVLTRATAVMVRQRFAELSGRVAELHVQGASVHLLVFVSAHGKAGRLHLTGTELPIDELRRLAKDTNADVKVLVVDACESGVITRPKGARQGPSYALSVEPPSLTGDVFIASSGAHEAAQEWDELGGSLFTHHWLTALRGDADSDNDGRVTLMEAYGAAARRTVAGSLDVGQHPQFDVGLAGAGDLVLTEPRAGGAHVVLEPTLEGRFVLLSQPSPHVVAEVSKVRGQPLRLAVPPGRYLLRQTTGFRVAMQAIELPYGGAVSVDGQRFVVRDYAEVVLKGGLLEVHPSALRLVASLVAPAIEGTPARWSGALGYRHALSRWWASGSVGFSPASYRGDALRVDEWRASAQVGGGYRFWAGPLVVMPGVGLEGSLQRQHFTRDNEAAIRLSYPPLMERVTFGVALGPQLWAEAPLVGALFLTAGVQGWVRFLSAERQGPVTLGADASLGLGVRW